jgi:drug/metabolite transporter (DMT)-like permease
VTRQHVYFIAMSVAWGLTWIAVKIGITAVPPVFFGAARFMLVSLLLVVWVRGFMRAFSPDLRGRVVLTALFVNVLTYVCLFWGMQFVESGVSSIINLALMPVSLYVLTIVAGEDRLTWRHGAALLLGLAGLLVLFRDKATFSLADREILGAAAIVVATLTYAIGSVIGKPLLARLTVWQIMTAQALVGALGLSLVSLAVEPVTIDTVRRLLTPGPFGALVFLVVLGTFVGYGLFLRLVRDWGAPRAGLYSFVSPVVALFVGWAFYNEKVGVEELAGGTLMLAGAALALLRRQPASGDTA